MESTFFKDSNLSFQVLNEGLVRKKIDDIFSYNFDGKDYVIQFYSVHNGVFFPDGAIINRSHLEKKQKEIMRNWK